MRQAFVGAILLVIASGFPAHAQRGERAAAAGGTVSFAVVVTDSTGAPLPGVDVDVSGPADRDARTEAGRIAFEDLPAGTYRFKFQKNGFITIERDVVARGRVPIDVKVAMDAAPALPPAAPVPVAAPPLPRPSVDAKPLLLDLPSFIEKNYVGKAPQKTSALICTSGGPATLLQLNDTVAENTYADADEFIYVIAGQGTATLGSDQDPLEAGTFLLIPRGTKHAFVPGPKKPLVMISILAGGTCGAKS